MPLSMTQSWTVAVLLVIVDMGLFFVFYRYIFKKTEHKHSSCYFLDLFFFLFKFFYSFYLSNLILVCFVPKNGSDGAVPLLGSRVCHTTEALACSA